MKLRIESTYPAPMRIRYLGGRFVLSPGINVIDEVDWKEALANDPRVPGHIVHSKMIVHGKRVDWFLQQLQDLGPEEELPDVNALDEEEVGYIAARLSKETVGLLLTKAERGFTKRILKDALGSEGG